MKSRFKLELILFFILFLGAFFRFYNINWDNGHHLHPDERAITIAVSKLQFPQSFSQFISPQSPLNPNFFAYGSFPMYLLRISGSTMGIFNPLFAQYDSINLVGRVLSAFADLVTIILLFKISRKLFNPQVGFLAAFFYSISVLPIQLSHFYAVDTLLTCFILATIYSLLLFYEKPGVLKSLLVGLFFGLSLATKVSAVVLVVSIGAAVTSDFILIFLKKPRKIKHWFPHLPAFIKHLLKYAFLIISSTLATFIFFEPYALIDFKNFWLQTLQQSELTKNPFYFPYTLQYVGKIPYIYELKNILLWGMGPVLASLSFAGAIYFAYQFFAKKDSSQRAKEIIIFVFFLGYFLVVGKFAVGFMRYMLPLYPIFALFVAVLVWRIMQSIKSRAFCIAICYLLLAISLVWPITFMHIYTQNNTRTDATDWINKNILPGKTLAIEHWDDGLPLIGQSNYHMLTLALYEPDTEQKWATINQELQEADYIIIASNRLYTPLQKLTDCTHLPSFRCYGKTSKYYKDLFQDKLGFQKVAEFANYPTIPILNLPINDQGADESFTVNDHPIVLIFQKNP